MAPTSATAVRSRTSPWRIIGLTVVVVMALGGALWSWLRPATPWVDGKPVRQWVLLACDQNAAAREKVLTFPAQAAPELNRVLMSDEPLPSQFGRWIEPHVPLAWMRFLPTKIDMEMRRRGAVSLLASMERHSSVAREGLVRSLRDPSPYVSGKAANILMHWGVPTPEAVPHVLRLCSQTNEFLLIQVLWGLRRVGVPAADGVPHLIRHLTPTSGQQIDLRIPALLGLKEYGTAAAPARDLFLNLASDPDPGIRLFVYQCLKAAELKDAATVDVLTKALEDPELSHRIQVLQALGSIGPPARTAVPKIVETMRNNVAEFWRLGRAALLLIAPETPEANQALLDP